MKNTLTNYYTNIVDETINNIQSLVKINSARDVEHKSIAKPFGPGVDLAFDEFLRMCENYGFRTFKDPDGYYAYAEIGPEDGQLIGILGHLDVVPGGENQDWCTKDAFSAEIVDDKIIGRGSLDDKGPVVVNLMAIKGLLDVGYQFQSRVRIIVGGAEETTWECIDKYKEEQEIPVVSYSPDSNFPLTNAEKTLYQFNATAKNNYNFTITSQGSYNAVCAKVNFSGEGVEALKMALDKLQYEYNVNDDGSITVLGKSVHAKECHMGVNAILRLAQAMYEADIHSVSTDYLATVIKQSAHGEIILGEKLEEDVSGVLTLNVGVLTIKDGEELIGFDSRVPVLFEEQEILDKYQASIEQHGLEFEKIDYLRKLYVPADSKLVSTLMKIYQEISHDMVSKPQASGGATYSRAWDNCVAYGMVFEHDNMISKMHQDDECLEIKFILPALQIYGLAIYELDQIDFRSEDEK